LDSFNRKTFDSTCLAGIHCLGGDDFISSS